MKFKTTLTTPQTSIEHPSTSNNLEELAAVAAANRRRRYTSSDYTTTEVSLYNSKTDSWTFNLTDEITQTGSFNGGSSLLLNGACTDAERQQQQQRQSSYIQEDETTDLLSTSKQRTNSSYLQHSPLKPASSNLIIATENPWRKLSNVRYKLGGQDDANQPNQTHYQHVHEQHITFV